MFDLDALQAAAEEATPGPWTADCCPSANMVYGPSDSIGVDAVRADAEFIAAANPAVVLELVAAHRAALARIARVEALHRRYGLYELEDSCTNPTDEHREEHHHECADEVGEIYCDQMPVGTVCSECRTEDGEQIDYPCATVRALTEGEPSE